jgi:antitoxin VapB
LARELAQLTGETITEAVVASLEARLEYERSRRRGRDFRDIVDRFGLLPVIDERTSDEIMGYDEHGLAS